MSFIQDIRRGINSSDIGILIQEEKDVIKSYQKLVKEQSEASKYLAIWGKKDGSDDIIDVSEKLWVVLDYITEATTECVKKLEIHREMLKDIRKIEEALEKLRDTEKSLAHHLKDATKKQKNVQEATKNLEDCKTLILEKDAYVMCEKRRLLQSAMHVKMDGIIEMSSKCSIAASYGKYLADQIPQGKLSPGQQLPLYTGKPTTQHILGDCLTALKDWKHPNPSTFDPSYALNRKMSTDSLQDDHGNSITNTTSLGLSQTTLSHSQPPKPYQDTENRRQSYQTSSGLASIDTNPRPVSMHTHNTSVGSIVPPSPNGSGFMIQPSGFLGTPPLRNPNQNQPQQSTPPQQQQYYTGPIQPAAQHGTFTDLNGSGGSDGYYQPAGQGYHNQQQQQVYPGQNQNNNNAYPPPQQQGYYNSGYDPSVNGLPARPSKPNSTSTEEDDALRARLNALKFPQ